MQNDRTSRSASNKAIRWRPSYDGERDIICTAFGLDFGSIILQLKKVKLSSYHRGTQADQNSQTTTSELPNALFRQRISVYMQRSASAALPGPRVTRFNTASRKLHGFAKSNTMIISEYSSGDFGEIVSIPSLLALDPRSTASAHMSSEVAVSAAIESTLTHILGSFWQVWYHQVSLIHDKHASLEDSIYENPSDGSHVRDVWAMSQHLHDMLRLVNRHAKVIEVIQEDFKVFAERAEDQAWLDSTVEDFAELRHDIDTDYLQPLEKMIDLVSL
jgi:hypothetical protein